MIFVLAGAALLAGAPLIAAVLVSVASVREDAAKSLSGFPPGRLARAVRRLLQASVGGSGPLQSSHRLTSSTTRGRPRWQPLRKSRPAQIPAAVRPRTAGRAAGGVRASAHEPGRPAPRWPADDERAARSPDALATPRS
ncbi:MAG TPA: hypothetical protein VH520_09275 [Streptosporangiaceae bacterium]